MTEQHAVVIVGGGPTGMVLAAELALAGVDVAIVERRPDHEIAGSRAGGLHARTIEVLDQRGVADRFLAEGQAMQVAGFALNPLDVGDFPTRHNYGLALWQTHIERILAGWIAELPVRVYRGAEATGVAQDAAGVDLDLADGHRLRAAWLVGCDGGRSLVRKAAGIDFPGWDPTVSHLIAEVEMADEPQLGMRNDAYGLHGLSKLEDGRTIRVMLTERDPAPAADPDLATLSAALTAVYGTDYGVHSPRSISRFTDMTRQAAAYRERRILLAGDAAHVHYPAGGQGLNLGVQDAVNLGWKLAQVVKGTSPDTLLDTYHRERHPIAARVLQLTMAQGALMRSDERSKAANAVVGELLRMDEPRRRFAGIMSGLDLRYDLGEGHPLLGRRMPDLDLTTADGARRVYSFLHQARPVLLDFAGGLDIGPWADRVPRFEAGTADPWNLPVVGEVPPPAAVLVRPDGYVAWVGEGTRAGLDEALARWFGPPLAP